MQNEDGPLVPQLLDISRKDDVPVSDADDEVLHYPLPTCNLSSR
jgi:hypothetical protein